MYKLLIILIVAAIIAAVARMKGYNPVVWFFIGALLFPFSLLVIILLPDKRLSQSYGRIKYHRPSNDNSSRMPKAPCSQCGRQIPINASQCQYCGKKYDIIDTEAKKKND